MNDKKKVKELNPYPSSPNLQNRDIERFQNLFYFSHSNGS